MRILHTSDWHLGRQFHNVSLLEDQVLVLEQLVRIARERNVDVVIIAGDVFDRSVPPAAATRVLDDVINALCVDPAIPMIITPGNHDGAERLGFGARAMRSSGIHIRSRIEFEPVVIEDAHGPVSFHCLPYADPVSVSDSMGERFTSHDEAMAALVAEATRRSTNTGRQVLVAHCFVTGGTTRESERPLSVGGADSVSVAHFEPFHYTALGHLHNPQSFLDGRVRYCGSLMKYSFSEFQDHKSVLLVDMDAHGNVEVEPVALSPRRDLRILTGHLKDLLAAGSADPGGDDYLLVRLEDTHAILDVMSKLREVYPNVLHVERLALQRAGEGARTVADHLHVGELPMFADFWRQVTGEPLTDEARAIVAATLDTIRHKEDH
jgi:DNA repair protein SbcD/Mre11